jgi:Ca-activated chloride channel homolog
MASHLIMRIHFRRFFILGAAAGEPALRWCRGSRGDVRAVLLAVLWTFFLSSSLASPGRALKDYEQGQYDSSRQEYQRLLQRKPEDPRLQYNAGTAAYQAREYDVAARHLTNALTASELQLQEQAYYNLGNTFYRMGEKADEPNAKIQTWEQSLQSYESALKLNDQDVDAKFNKELVKKQLEELKKQQQQNQPKNQDQDKNKDQDKDQNKDQNPDKQDKKDKQDSSPQQQNQPNQNPQDQQANKDQKSKDQQQKQPPPAPKDQSAQSDSASKPSDEKEDEQSADTAAKPGQMTRQQAQQLLDNQKNNEKALLLLPPEMRQQRSQSFKNW